MLPVYRRILLLTEGRLGPFTSKTAASLLRYRAQDIVGIIDSAAAGKDVRTLVPWSRPLPILAAIGGAQELRPDALFIGIAPSGGELPESMRWHIGDALRAGIDVVSGLHTLLGEDGEFVPLAAAAGARIVDVRRPPSVQVVASGKARKTRCRRILTVGTDCNVGKMVTSLELTAAAQRRGLDARFVATGQTGIMISGRGIAIDAVVSDFGAGAVESTVLEAGDCDICFVEGQGSIAHPGFSGVTLSLLHGCCPDAMVLVHHVGRTHYRGLEGESIPDLPTLCRLYEAAAGVLRPARMVGVALNGLGASEGEVAAARSRISAELGLPAADPIADGCRSLLDAVLGHH